MEKEDLLEFLSVVDCTFPVPLSNRENLDRLTDNLINYGTLCVKKNDHQIIGIVAGYTRNVINNKCYISVVTVRSEFQRKGIASQLIRQFLNEARKLRLDAVHLYYNSSNLNYSSR